MRVLTYLKDMMDHSLKFKRRHEKLIGYAGADWRSCVHDRRSYTEYVFLFSGTPASLVVKKQRNDALSSTEAEYMALTEAAKEAIYIQTFYFSLVWYKSGHKSIATMWVYWLKTTLVIQEPNIDLRHHFIGEIYENVRIRIDFVLLEPMTADIQTKSLAVSNYMICV